MKWVCEKCGHAYEYPTGNMVSFGCFVQDETGLIRWTCQKCTEEIEGE